MTRMPRMPGTCPMETSPTCSPSTSRPSGRGASRGCAATSPRTTWRRTSCSGCWTSSTAASATGTCRTGSSCTRSSAGRSRTTSPAARPTCRCRPAGSRRCPTSTPRWSVSACASSFADLPERARRVCELRYLLGLEIDEIARQLEMTRNAVDQALHRAHARLRDARGRWLTSPPCSTSTRPRSPAARSPTCASTWRGRGRARTSWRGWWRRSWRPRRPRSRRRSGSR